MSDSKDKNSQFLKRFLRKMRSKKVIICLSSLIVFCGLFFVFATNYEIPLPFDAYRMSVELMPHAVFVDKNGRLCWQELESAKSYGNVPEDYSNVKDVLVCKYQGINNISETSVGRTINRDGKDIRVVYYCYTKSLWESLFIDPDLQEFSESGMSTGTNMYGDHYQTLDYEPQMTEVYYLPNNDLFQMNDLSDADYDHLRTTCDLIWSGTI